MELKLVTNRRNRSHSQSTAPSSNKRKNVRVETLKLSETLAHELTADGGDLESCRVTMISQS